VGIPALYAAQIETLLRPRDLHFITFRVRRSPPLRGAPFEAPLKNRGNPSGLRVKQGKQSFFASWFRRGRGRFRHGKEEERFLPARPGAHKPCGRKSRVAPVGMTGYGRVNAPPREAALPRLKFGGFHNTLSSGAEAQFAPAMLRGG